MRTRKRNGLASVPLVLLALWAVEANSMMGADGPPPCESQACFIEAVSACKAETSFMTTTAANAQAQYLVEGSTDDGRCKVGMIYMQHPRSEWTYTPLHFVLDRDGDIGNELKRTVEDCLSGDADRDRQCSGPLLEQLSLPQ